MSYILKTNVKIAMPQKANHPVIKELTGNYTYGTNWLFDFCHDKNCITIGECTGADIADGEYVLSVTDSGVYISGVNYSAVIRGYISFLEKIKYNEAEDVFYAENVLEIGKPYLNLRCVHLCVFPETEYDFLRKCIRSCAISMYSHVITEFWGMLKFDCMKELSWPFAYDKKEIKDLFDEARALGLEIIPMFNHLGHAASARAINGKHVVLDRNPKLEYMFESYGWIWNVEREDVRNLHRCIREELMELCGDGEYFHLGCDEAYAYGHDINKAKVLYEYLNEIADELKAKGRRPIMWHDMLLEGSWTDGYASNSSKEVAKLLIDNVSRDFVVADWEYFKRGEIWRSSATIREAGFDVLCCPWDKYEVIEEAVETAETLGCKGIIHTTWQSLDRGFPKMVYAGRLSYDAKLKDNNEIKFFYCAHVVRKAMPSNGEYEKTGWTKKMVAPGL